MLMLVNGWYDGIDVKCDTIAGFNTTHCDCFGNDTDVGFAPSENGVSRM